MKKKTMLWIGGLLLTGIMVGGITKVVLAQKDPFNADFLDPEKWEIYQGDSDGSWDNKKGVLTVDGGTGNKAIYKKAEYGDFQFETEVTIEQPDNQTDDTSAEGGILFRIQNPGDGVDSYDGYYFGIDVNKQQVILGKSSTDGEPWTEVATKKMYLEYDQPYKLTVKAAGEHIQGFVNEEKDSYPKIDVSDEDYVRGQIGVRNRLENATFEKMTVAPFNEAEVKGATYTNSLVPEAADPDVLYDHGTYYLYPTTAGSNNDGIKVYTSTDLVNWTDKGMAMTAGNENWGTQGFWAPDLIERDGKYYMYYTANEQLCVSIADSPLGPFTQKKVAPMHEDTKEIDAHAFKDEDGQYYLYFVRFTGGNVIWGAKLNDDMVSIDESTVTEVLAPSQPWEKDIADVNEGPYMLKKEGIYYLTYSGSHFESPMYGAGYATSSDPLGSFEKYEQNPIMQSNSLAHGTGHHAVTESPDGKEMFMVYHRHESIWNTDPREFAIDRMHFTENEKGKTILEVHGPTVTPQPVPSGAVDVDNFIGFETENIREVTVKRGTNAKDWSLPEEVGLITSKSLPGESQKVAVKWQLPESIESGKITIKGEVVLPDKVENLGDLPLALEITVTIK
ncbi:family 43 glycosylhydrolase [Carnobacterium sp.]|uniref:family 43 glycosylhydrolase n=1 Tax=Carnobacterium sp. TaxID=48221 RepID=UPI0028ACEB36|nr:family 43 glycosylhydrolase [Carnobacterium sp.]